VSFLKDVPKSTIRYKQHFFYVLFHGDHVALLNELFCARRTEITFVMHDDA
jgi:hypothetical protein